MALPSGCIAVLQRLGIFISQPEKHLWTPAAFYSVLVRVRPKGVQKYSTPSDTTPSRSASTALGLERCFSGSRQAFVARGVPPIHFGREEGVERTLLRVACQSETFLAPPWQGGIDIRILWHIGCQSEFEECFRRTTRISFRIYRNTGFSPWPPFNM